MPALTNFKKLSREEWGKTYLEGQKPSFDDIKLGAILRIADAAESMAKNFNDLIAENERLKRANKLIKEDNIGLHNSIRAYKGTITKVKNKTNVGPSEK